MQLLSYEVVVVPHRKRCFLPSHHGSGSLAFATPPLTSRRQGGLVFEVFPRKASRVIVGDQDNLQTSATAATAHLGISSTPRQAVLSIRSEPQGAHCAPPPMSPALSTPGSRSSLRPAVATRLVSFRPRAFATPRRFSPETGLRAYCSPLPAGVRHASPDPRPTGKPANPNPLPRNAHPERRTRQQIIRTKRPDPASALQNPGPARTIGWPRKRGAPRVTSSTPDDRVCFGPARLPDPEGSRHTYGLDARLARPGRGPAASPPARDAPEGGARAGSCLLA
jgi:hypothetical protein